MTRYTAPMLSPRKTVQTELAGITPSVAIRSFWPRLPRQTLPDPWQPQRCGSVCSADGGLVINQIDGSLSMLATRSIRVMPVMPMIQRRAFGTMASTWRSRLIALSVGNTDAAGVKDVCLESALTTIQVAKTRSPPSMPLTRLYLSKLARSNERRPGREL